MGVPDGILDRIYGQRDHAVGRDCVDEADDGSLRHGRSFFVIGFARPGFESVIQAGGDHHEFFG